MLDDVLCAEMSVRDEVAGGCGEESVGGGWVKSEGAVGFYGRGSDDRGQQHARLDQSRLLVKTVYTETSYRLLPSS
jgi:hypothetical protein